MASKRQPIGYTVRRPLTLWGQRREIGDYIPAEDVVSMTRLESMVRAGRFLPVYAEVEEMLVAKTRSGRKFVVIKEKGNDEPIVRGEPDLPPVPKTPKKRAVKKVAKKAVPPPVVEVPEEPTSVVEDAPVVEEDDNA